MKFINIQISIEYSLTYPNLNLFIGLKPKKTLLTITLAGLTKPYKTKTKELRQLASPHIT
jgi:hypothetical protein